MIFGFSICLVRKPSTKSALKDSGVRTGGQWCTSMCGQGDSGAPAWASRDSGVRTGGQWCTSMGLQGQWCADRGTVVHQHGPPGTVVCGQGDSGAPTWASRDSGVRCVTTQPIPY